jgi:S-(hydroxymethyl)glutathione dehydrogenase/alcohol dehydrogenase
MKAAVLYKANTPLEVVDVKQEDPRPGEARVKVKAAGVCHSDWHIMNGDWTVPLPMVLGHEAAGIVEEVGAGVTTVKAGDHVIFSFRPQCGHCLYCSIGRSVLCDGHNDTPRWVMFDGTARLSRNGESLNQLARIGTFAEKVVCPAEQLVPIRPDMPWPQAALVGCCVPTGVGAVTRCAEVEAGASVLVIGCGGVGLNVIQGARIAGAERIIAVDMFESKLKMAEQFGATDLVKADDGDPVAAVQALTGGRGADVAFEVIGLGATIEQAIGMARNGGEAILVGVPRMDVMLNLNAAFTFLYLAKTVKGCWYGSSNVHQDVPKLVQLYKDGQLMLEELVSREIGVDGINEAFTAMGQGEVARSLINHTHS